MVSERRLADDPCRGTPSSRARTGLALPLVLLLLLALTGLAHGVYLLALQDRAAATASRALLQARLLAEGGVRRTLDGILGDTVPDGDSVGAGQGTVPGGSWAVELHRLDRELLWLEGTGTAALSPGGPERALHRTARVVWALSPPDRLAAFRAVIEHGGGVLSQAPGAVDGSGVRAASSLDAPRGCHDRLATLAEIAPTGALPSERRVSAAESLMIPRLGLLSLDSLLARASPVPGGALSPRPVVEGELCRVDASTNWGSPLAPAGPCGGHRPTVASRGDLELRGGEGQGLLVVDGDLVLSDAAVYAGLVLVSGDLTMGPGAELRGLAQVRGRVRLGVGARVTGRLCPALLALEAALPLRHPVRLPGSGWLGPL